MWEKFLWKQGVIGNVKKRTETSCRDQYGAILHPYSNTVIMRGSFRKWSERGQNEFTWNQGGGARLLNHVNKTYISKRGQHMIKGGQVPPLNESLIIIADFEQKVTLHVDLNVLCCRVTHQSEGCRSALRWLPQKMFQYFLASHMLFKFKLFL